MALAVVVMGVSGSGKTTLGRRLARALRAEFADGDDYHSEANVAKMAAGRPLDDDDRAPWLDRLRDIIADRLARGRSLVLACSALKARYRATLAAGDPRVRFVYLRGDYATILARMERRRGHYMRPELLRSQFDALEPPAGAITVDIAGAPSRTLDTVLAGLAGGGAAEAAEALARRRARARARRARQEDT